MNVELLSITSNAEKLCEKSARVCYNSENKGTKDSYKTFLPKIIKSGHESVIEHSCATFRISGISRACSHQLVRHRLCSFSQRSQRYVNEEDSDYVVPPKIKLDTKVKYTYNEAMLNCLGAYKSLIKLGIKKEDARYVLPNACITELVMSANFREWRHVIKLRCHKSAQWEIQEVIKKVLIILNKEAPSIFGDLAKEYL